MRKVFLTAVGSPPSLVVDGNMVLVMRVSRMGVDPDNDKYVADQSSKYVRQLDDLIAFGLSAGVVSNEDHFGIIGEERYLIELSRLRRVKILHLPLI